MHIASAPSDSRAPIHPSGRCPLALQAPRGHRQSIIAANDKGFAGPGISGCNRIGLRYHGLAVAFNEPKDSVGVCVVSHSGLILLRLCRYCGMLIEAGI